MAKPILIIKVPRGTNQDDILENLNGKLTDYYVLIVEHRELKNIAFQVFYEKDMTDIKFDGLKEYVTELIREQ